MRALRILIFHGYLLQGTGSNVYNAELAAALVRAGHEVHLLAQDRAPRELDWVDATGDWDGGALRVDARREPVRGVVYRPDIGGLLPVYVADRYEGLVAKPFQDLTEDELDGYLSRNVAAVREVAERVRPDLALANHLVMGPVVLARALAGLDVPYVVKVHGSALEYTVKPHPRFKPYAVEGLAGARAVLVGSRHTAESLWAEMDDPAVVERTRLGPPGVDVARFVPREPAAAAAGLAALRDRLASAEPQAAQGDGDPASASPHTHHPPASGNVAAIDPGEPPHADEPAPHPASSFDRSPGEAARALAQIAPGERLVVFVGKLIGSKGVELLLAAWPLVLAAHPDARLLVVGFGGFRDGLQELEARLAAGDLEEARQTRSEAGAPLPHLEAFLAALPGDDADRYRAAAASLPDRVSWSGRLDHEELTDVLPAAESMVVPSTFPEAFGMVAAEAAACGAFPVVARHSGLAEVARTLATEVPEPARPWLSFEVGPGAVRELAAAVVSWLDAGAGLREETREAIVQVAREHYSWDGVARRLIMAGEGRLDELPRP
jgi:glycosyltransferase involved in cell wall biosynthesis